MSATCNSVTLPSASNLSNSACVNCCWAKARVRLPPAVSAAVAAPTCSISRRVIINSVPNPRHAQLQPLIQRGEINLQVAIFLGVRRQLIGADINLAPLEALADIPDRQQAGAPSREMVVLAFRLAQPLAADPAIGRNAVTIGAGKVELAELTLAQRLAARDRGLGLFAGGVDRNRHAVGEVMQIDR